MEIPVPTNQHCPHCRKTLKLTSLKGYEDYCIVWWVKCWNDSCQYYLQKGSRYRNRLGITTVGVNAPDKIKQAWNEALDDPCGVWTGVYLE